MSSIISGSLDTTPFINVFKEIASENKTGILSVTTAENSFKIFFTDGKPLSLKTDPIFIDKAVVHFLSKATLLPPHVLAKCREKQISVVKTVTEILIEENFITMLLYMKIKSAATVLAFLTVFFEKSGSYHFSEEMPKKSEQDVKLPDYQAIFESLDILSLKKKELKNAYTWMFSPIKLKAEVKGISPNQPFFLNYLSSDRDFYPFFVEFLEQLYAKKIVFSYANSPQIAARLFAAHLVRGIFLLIFAALIFTILDKSMPIKKISNNYREIKTKHRSFFMERLYMLEKSSVPDIDKLFVNGYITIEEVDIILKSNKLDRLNSQNKN